MQVNGAMSSEVYTGYKSTGKTTVTEEFSFGEKQIDDSKEKTVTKRSTYTNEMHQEILSSGVNKEIPSNNTPSKMRSLGMGFLNVGNYGLGMSASQIPSDNGDVLVRVNIALADGKTDTIDVNLSKLDTRNATAVEMFAYCQYADANGTGIAGGTSMMLGSWSALKSVISPTDGMRFNTYDEAINTKRNWNSALAGSKTVLEKKSTGEKISAADLIEMIQKNHELTAENIDEKDWRYMSDKDWDRLIKDVDNYIDDVNKQMEQMKKLQNEAAAKAATDAPADMRTTAASNAALQVASNGFSGGSETEESATWLEENSWTFEMQTTDQEVLARAKAANEMAKDALSKTQEILLTGDTVAGISDTGNVKECASPKEDENKEREWIITAFGEQGIICNKCVGGKTETLWTLDYKNAGDYKKVWDFLDRFEKDTDLKFSGDKSFWEDFLADKIDIEEIIRQYKQ